MKKTMTKIIDLIIIYLVIIAIFALILAFSFLGYEAKTHENYIAGRATYYHDYYNGRRTASGAKFDNNKISCACNAVKLGTVVKVVNMANGKFVICKITDRIGAGALIDMSKAAFKIIAPLSAGVIRVKIFY